jgi:nicotinamidase-related amidase
MAHEINKIDPATSALLVMDHQKLLVEGFMSDPAAHLASVASVTGRARSLGMPVIYIQKCFRAGYPEVHDNNMIFTGVRAGRRLLETDDMTAIPEEIKPQGSDLLVRAHRVSAFEGTELSLLLRAGRIDTLVMFGITTSGVVLSTVRQGADKDFRMFVIRDLCGDNDEEVHEWLLEKIIPRQAAVVDSADFLAAWP